MGPGIQRHFSNPPPRVTGLEIATDTLPDWATRLIYGQVLWKWIALAVPIVLALGAVYALYRWGRRKPWNGSLGRYLRFIAAPLGALVLAPLLQYLAWQQINITSDAAELPIYFLEVAEGLAAVWIVWLTASWIAAAMIAQLPRISSKGVDAHLIRLAARSIGLGAVLVLLFRVAHAVGIPLYGLVAVGHTLHERSLSKYSGWHALSAQPASP